MGRRPLHRTRDALASDEWRYPLLFGGASIPVSGVLHWLSAGTYVLVPVLVAGAVVGYLFGTRATASVSVRAGWRTGVAGGLVLPWFGIDFTSRFPDIAAGRTVVWAFLLAGFVFTLVLYIAVHGVVGAAGGLLGTRLAERFERSLPTAPTE